MADAQVERLVSHLIDHNSLQRASVQGAEPAGPQLLQSLRPQDVAHHRQQLVRWWSQPGKWQWQFALQGRKQMEGWSGDRDLEAEEARWWMEATFRKAELYWVSPEMTEVITTLAPSIPDTLPQPPVEDAFVMFAQSIPGTDAENGTQIFTSAFLWGTVNMFRIGPCIAIENYAWRDLVAVYQGMGEGGQEAFRGIYPNRLMPTGGSEWPLKCQTSEFSNMPPVEDKVQKVSMIEDRKLLSTFWALCSQKIVVETRDRPDRAAVRRAQREGRKLDEVRVIRLREPTSHATGTGGTIEYSHRWIVGSHWRSQWYPSDQTHRPKLIEAYQKGPADKPLKVRETVRALVR